MSNIPWTEEEIDILRKLADAGYPAQDMVRVLKSRTLNAITNKMSGLGIKSRIQAPEIDYSALELMVEV